MSDLGRVKEKLDRLRQKDAAFQVFGADQHEYRLNPCLTEAQIQKFERAYEITLPPDYRAFLMEVGNGGAGPYYGIVPLEDSVPPGIVEGAVIRHYARYGIDPLENIAPFPGGPEPPLLSR